MVPRATLSALAGVAVACTSPAGTAPATPTPEPTRTCAIDADCADASACTADACSGGHCAWAYLPSTAVAILAGSPAGSLVQVPIPTTPVSFTGGSATLCPAGSDPLASPPVCVLEIDLANAALAFDALPAWSYRISGTVPVRVQRIPVTGTVYSTPFAGDVTVTGNGGCPGATQTFAAQSIVVSFSEDPAHGLTLALTATLDAGVLAGSITACGDAAFRSLVDQALPWVAPNLAASLAARIALGAAPELCLTPPCPGWAPDDGGICRVSPGGPCAARGIDPGTGMLVIPACGG